jgi:hypothetical protein
MNERAKKKACLQSMNFSLFRYGPDRKALAIVCGMSGAVGEIVVGIAFGIFGRFTVRHGRGSVVLLSCVVSMVAYLLILLLLPKEAPLGQTTPDQLGFIGEK